MVMLSFLVPALLLALWLYVQSPRQLLLAKPLKVRWPHLLSLVGILWLGYGSMTLYGVWPGFYAALSVLMLTLLLVPLLCSLLSIMQAKRRKP